jgi:hypothetical protein
MKIATVIENDMKYRLELVFDHISLENTDETPIEDALTTLSLSS